MDGRELEVKGLGETIRLKPGEHGYEIRRGDQIITTGEFQVVRGDNPVLRITVEETAATADRPDPAPRVAGVQYELLFDGESSYVKTPVKYDGSHPLTLEAWVRIGEGSGYQHVISNYCEEARGISLEINPEGRWLLAMRLSEKSKYAHAVSTRAAPFGRRHVAMVFEANQPSLFVDGLRLAIRQFSDQEKYQPSMEAFTIGACKIGTSTATNVFTGSIDEVRISRTARYRNDFVPAKRFEPDEHTMALYHFDEGTGDIAHDASGNGHHATIVGAQWVRVGFKRPLSGIVATPAEIPGIGPWQVATKYPSSEIRSVAWSPDGTRIACGTDAGWLRIYDAQTLQLVRLLGGDKGRIDSVAWSPDGQWLATGSIAGRSVQLWQADGQPGPVLKLGSGVTSVAWHPDGQQLAIGTFNGQIRLSSADGKSRSTIEGHRTSGSDISVWCVAGSPDGQQLASASEDRTVRLWQPDGTSGPVFEGHHASVLSVSWSPDGIQLVSGAYDGEIRVWNVDGKPGFVLQGHELQVRTVAWSPDGTSIVSGSFDGTVRIWQADGTGEPVVERAEGGHVNSVAWSPDGQRIVAGLELGAMRLWSKTGEPGPGLPGNNRMVYAVACNPASSEIALTTGNHSSQVRFWHPDGTPARILHEGSDPCRSLAWSPNGEGLAIGGGGGTLHLWQGDSSPLITLQGHQNWVTSLAWSPDGQRLVSGSRDKTVRVWQADGTLGPTLEGHTNSVWSVAWRPDGNQLASVQGASARIWNVDGTLDRVFDGSSPANWSIAWSPDGKWLATGGYRGVRLWQDDGKPGPMATRISGVLALAWSPDGRLLASGSEATTIRLWYPDCTLRSVLRGHLGRVNTLSWMPDGKHLVSGDDGGTIRMWDAETGQAVWTAVCLRDGRHVTFGPTGEILHGHPKIIEDELVYLVAKADGSSEMLKPSEFQQRKNQATPPAPPTSAAP